MKYYFERFDWYRVNDRCFVIGQLFDGDTGQYYEGQELLAYFSDVQSKQIFVEKLYRANGHFAVVLQLPDGRWLAAVDRLRARPLFYSCIDQEIFVADSAYCLADHMPNQIDDLLAQSCYWETGWVAGQDTYYQGIKQLAAGQYLEVQDNTIIKIQRYAAKISLKHDANWPDLWQQCDTVSQQVFDRLWQVLRGRTAVVPLSAGWDSRYILTELKKRNYANVICFSYGEPNQHEWRIAKHIAQKFGYPFYYVPYRNYSELAEVVQLKAYLKYGYHYANLPHIQDFFAVAYLHRKQLLPKDSVFLPGHSGDFLGGSWLRKQIKRMPDNMPWPERVWQQHCIGLDTTDKSSLLRYFEASLPIEPEASSLPDILLAEYFNMMNRQSKFIVNAVRVYEFFGYDWYLPLWDGELVEFWQSMPLVYRTDKLLYRQYLHARFGEFAVTDCQLKVTNLAYWCVLPTMCYRRFRQPTGWQWQRLIEYLRSLLPRNQAIPKTKDMNLLLRYVLQQRVLQS